MSNPFKFLKSKTIKSPATGKELEYIERPDSALILVEGHNDQFLFVTQFRAGANDYTYECPGGVVEEGHSALETALLELKQETGYSPDDLLFISNLGSYYTATGWSDEVVHLFYAKLNKTAIGGEQELDEDESVKVVWANLEEFKSLSENKPIPAKTALLIEKVKQLL